MTSSNTDSDSEDFEEHNAAEGVGDKSAEKAPGKERDATTKTTSGEEAGSSRQDSQRQQANDHAEHGQALALGGGSAPVEWEVGGGDGGPQRSLLVLALDGATPELALGAWRDDLRHIRLLSEGGTYARISSTVPCASTPAWASLFTGFDPGQLGVYAAAQRPNHSYAPPIPLGSHAVHLPRLWDTLSQAGQLVGVVGAPLTSPAPAVRGHLIGDENSAHTIVASPPAFAQQVAQWLADEPSAEPAPGSTLETAIGQIYARTEQRFQLARRMLARSSYSCFVLFDDGIAQIQRLLWHTLDVTHLRHQPTHPLGDVISAFYRFVDDQIGELLELIDSETVVAVVSATGAQALDGELALNDWLQAEGYLRLHSAPARPTPLAECAVDWANTRAWAGENGMIYLNLAGREPEGIVAPDDADATLEQIAAQLHALLPPAGIASEAPVFTSYRPATLYAATQGVGADLLVATAQPGWRTNALVGQPRLWLSARADALDAAYESRQGLFIFFDPRNPTGGTELSGVSVYDIAPTLLNVFGIAPPRTRGRALA